MRPGRAPLAVLALGVLLAASGTAIAPAGASSRSLSVIVTLAPGTDPVAASRSLLGGRGTVTQVYRSALDGFAADLPQALLSSLLGDVRVLSIVPDTGRRITAAVTQNSAPSGLDRVDQRALPLNGRYSYSATGSGVTAYVIDTGLTLRHPDFGGRAVSGVDEIDGGTASDCNGHGTHVGGLIGGRTYGVAKQVKLVAVRVLDCTGAGSDAQVIAGIDWVIRNHTTGPAVANLSLGGEPSTAIDAAVTRLVADGVSVSVAGGNDNADACGSSPGRVPQVLTVGASDTRDVRAPFSDVGACIDLFAPGVSITSDWLANGRKVLSGTSMASPLVAGAAALYLQTHRTASPAALARALVAASTRNRITDTDGGCALLVLCTPATPNNDLLYTRF